MYFIGPKLGNYTGATTETPRRDKDIYKNSVLLFIYFSF